MIAIKNKSKNSVLSTESIECSTIWSKFLGLMFLKIPKVLIFKFSKEHKISLHMLFVFFPIDVLFLDKNKKTVDIKENFRPFTFYTSKEKALYAIELQKGTIKKSKTEIGDEISFKDA